MSKDPTDWHAVASLYAARHGVPVEKIEAQWLERVHERMEKDFEMLRVQFTPEEREQMDAAKERAREAYKIIGHIQKVARERAGIPDPNPKPIGTLQ